MKRVELKKRKRGTQRSFKAIGHDNQMGVVSLTWVDGTKVRIEATERGMKIWAIEGPDQLLSGRLAMIQSGAVNTAEIIRVE